MLSELLDQFDTVYDGYPAKVFDSSVEAVALTTQLERLEINFRAMFVVHPKRLKLPVQTAVVLIGWGKGVRH